MFPTIINVTGYRGCERVSVRILALSEADFAVKVAAWAAEEGVTEWSRDSMPAK